MPVHLLADVGSRRPSMKPRVGEHPAGALDLIDRSQPERGAVRLQRTEHAVAVRAPHADGPACQLVEAVTENHIHEVTAEKFGVLPFDSVQSGTTGGH